MGDTFKVDLSHWHSFLPASEIDAEFACADFTGRALANAPRTLAGAGVGALIARGVAGEPARSPGGRRGLASNLSMSTSAMGSSIVGMIVQDQGSGGVGGGVSWEGSSAMKWELHAPVGDGPEGEAPTPRSGHAAVTLGRRMYVCGGLAEDGGQREYLMDLFKLDLSIMCWSRIRVSDRADGEEVYHTCEFVYG